MHYVNIVTLLWQLINMQRLQCYSDIARKRIISAEPHWALLSIRSRSWQPLAMVKLQLSNKCVDFCWRDQQVLYVWQDLMWGLDMCHVPGHVTLLPSPENVRISQPQAGFGNFRDYIWCIWWCGNIRWYVDWIYCKLRNYSFPLCHTKPKAQACLGYRWTQIDCSQSCRTFVGS